MRGDRKHDWKLSAHFNTQKQKNKTALLFFSFFPSSPHIPVRVPLCDSLAFFRITRPETVGRRELACARASSPPVCSCISRFLCVFVRVCESVCVSVCESVFAKLAESGFGGFERWHLHGGEPRPTARSTPLHTHTHKNTCSSTSSAFLIMQM